MGSNNGSSKRPASSVLSLPPSLPNSLPSLVNADDNDDDEEKVDKFFALVSNIKAMRDLWSANDKQKKRTRVESPTASLWKPTFEWEDFQEVDIKDPLKDGDQAKKKKKDDGDRENCLNLKLAL